jgi:hypothetical protein
MKSSLFQFILFVALGLNVNAQSQFYAPFAITNQFEGRTWVVDIHERDLEKTTRWDPRIVQDPPLAPGKAISVARDYIKGLIDGTDDSSRSLVRTVRSASLLKAGIYADVWIYDVKIELGRGGFAQYPFDIIVTMDGRIATCNEIKNR